MTRKYEVVYIFDSSLDEEQINGRLGKLHSLLASPEKPEPLTSLSHWGKRTLAYPIKRHESGHYVVANLETRPDRLAEFERAVRLDEGVIRYLMILNEGEQPRPPSQIRSRDEEGEEPGPALEAEV